MTNPGPSDPARLRVGHVAGVTVTKWRTIWKQRYPQVPLDVVEVARDEQRRALDAGAVELCFVRLPVDAEGLHVIRLYEEQPVVWVSKDHPLAAFDEVTDVDLAGENVLVEADPGSIELVAQADAVLCVPMSIARSHSRRDLVYRPLTDAPTTTVALVWPVDSPHEWIDEFIGVVRGRTENSSRTAQDRAAGRAPEKKPKASPAAAPDHRTGHRRRQRRR